MKTIFNPKHILLFAILATIALSSCDEDKKKFTYVIKGKLIDGTNNASFQNKKLEAYNTYTARGSEYLGKCTINSNNEFNIQYELNSNLTGNHLKLYIVDTTFAATSKLKILPIGENWDKNLYVGDSATVDVYLSRDLEQKDTLYLMSNFSKITFTGPTQNKHIGKIRIINSTAGEYYYYSIGTYKITKNVKYVTYIPTGDPIIDVITLNINN